MTYKDKRALATKKSPTSLTSFVSLDDIVRKIIAEQSGTFDTTLIEDLLADYPTNAEVTEDLAEYSTTAEVLLKSAGYTSSITKGLVNITIVDGQITAVA